MLQNKIKEMTPYFVRIEMVKDTTIITVRYKEKWNVYNSKDGRIKVAKSPQTANEYMYYAKTEEVELDDMFRMIEETIAINENAEKKAKLLMDKVQELKAIFEQEDYKTLESLTFKYRKKKKKSLNTKKEEKPVTENTDEETVENNEITSTNEEVENIE